MERNTFPIECPADLVSYVAQDEGVSEDFIKSGVSSGEIVVLKNRRHDIPNPCAVGKGLYTKVNANVGLSTGNSCIEGEILKMKAAVEAGADVVMDLSTGPDIHSVRERMLSECPVPLGTVPVYDLACIPGKDFFDLREDDFVEAIREQAEAGVDFFTIHSGVIRECLWRIKEDPRIMNIVSRGGALTASWMEATGRENPMFSRFDDIVDIAAEFSITLSLGDGLRPGAVSDATDSLQVQELLVLGDLQKRAVSKGVQVMIEGPGHVPIDQIEANVRLQKSICSGAPFYVLGPLVTDCAPGYDHITGAIGGAIAAWHGADFLCYVTPAEHLGLPDISDVKRGVIASKIAAHAADIVKRPDAIKRDNALSRARARRDWEEQFELSIDPALRFGGKKSPGSPEGDACSMCEEYCSIKITEDEILKRTDKGGA